MSRTLPDYCQHCGGVIDWGDFGPDNDDGSTGTTCTCPPPPPSLSSAMVTLAAAARALGYVVEFVSFVRAQPESETA